MSAKVNLWEDRDWFVMHYVEHRASINEMASLAGCCTTTIHNWRNKHGIPPRVHDMRVLTCMFCGETKAFSLRDSIEEPYFCCWQCREDYIAETTPIPERACEHCGTTYTPRFNEQRFCCQTCLHTAWRGRTIHGHCHHCGKPVSKPAYSLTSEHMFCDWDCYADYRRATPLLTAAAHPMYEGGFDWERRYWDNTEEAAQWREAVSARDGGKCYLCGAEERLTVHHIKSTREAPELRAVVSNGVLLCRRCHGRVHFAPDAIEERARLEEVA